MPLGDLRKSLLVMASALPPSLSAAQAAPAVDPVLDLRLRSETAESEAFASDSSATTLRVRAGLIARLSGALTAQIEGEGVAKLDGNYATAPGLERPMIADPEAFELNTALLQWRGKKGSMVQIGRQRLSYGNERFIGVVDFRQNQQTFDALRLRTRMGAAIEVDYAYAMRVHTPLGDRGPAEDLKGDIHLVQLTRSFGDLGTLAGQVLAIDIDDRPDMSSLTFGARYRNSHTLSEARGLGLGYMIEAAHQSEHGSAEGTFDLGYLAAEARLEHPAMTLTGGIESFEGNGERAFSTPLATLAKFQGRADVFTVMPADGLVDAYLGGAVNLSPASQRPIALNLTYHDFSSELGEDELGHEIDLVANWRLTDEVELEAAVADFDSAGAGPGDLRRVWVSLRYRLD